MCIFIITVLSFLASIKEPALYPEASLKLNYLDEHAYVEGAVLNEDSKYFEGKHWNYVNITGLVSRRRSIIQKIFIKDERDSYPAMMDEEIKSWLDKSRKKYPILDKNPDYTIYIMARVPKSKEFNCSIRDGCNFYLLLYATHGRLVLVAKSGVIHGRMQGSSLSISGRAELIYAHSVYGELQESAGKFVEFNASNITLDKNLMKEWRKEIGSYVSMDELESWVDEEE